MTDTEMRIAVAEAMGWKLFPAGKDSFGVHCEACASRGQEAILQKDLPDYPTSRDACAEFEATLTEDEQHQYVEILSQLKDCHSLSRRIWRVCTATPRQRCEAFLRVKGLWKEGAQ